MSNQCPLNVLLSPLDWGIGHATRCVPIINEFLDKGCNVIIASNGRSGEFLKKEFPFLKHIDINAYNISYSRSGKNMVAKMVFQIPLIIAAIFKEHYLLKKIVKENEINLIVSDNRYGLWHKKTHSVFMTHQLMIKMPKGYTFLEKIVHHMIRSFINRFDECWVPDYEGTDNISGDLSHKFKKQEKTFFIGPLSRFSGLGFKLTKTQKEIDILYIISGPEPQRSIFETLILNQVKNTALKIIIVRGVTECDEKIELSNNITMYSHLPTTQLAQLIKKSKMVVSRSGYSTIMDLLVLEANAILVPTPGQTEQIYLASYLMEKKIFHTILQDKFSISTVLDLADTPTIKKPDTVEKCYLLTKRISEITESIIKK